MICTKQYNLALLGDPIAHSNSPFEYARLFDADKVNGNFSLITMSDCCSLRSTITAQGLDAFAVTMPLKRTIADVLDDLSPDAKRAASVNLVTVSNGIFTGHTTDGEGFFYALGKDISATKLVLYGTGGAARSIVCAAEKRGANIFVCDRNPKNARAFCHEFDTHFVETLNDIPAADMFINATPAGMKGYAPHASYQFLNKLKRGAYVCDLIYEPNETELITRARDMGFFVQNGRGMLTAQAKIAWDIIKHRGAHPNPFSTP